MSGNYWSSTTNANNTDNAWNVNFNNGNVNNNNKSNSYYVRAVRSGKCSLLSFESVYQAYLDCRKRKRGTVNALRFEANALTRLFDLSLDIQRGTYQPSRSVCFITMTPKLREIFAADFKDRIIHHLVVRQLEEIWEPRFIYDSYASRKGKGVHGAVKRLRTFMRKVTKNGKRKAYFLQLDIRSFFISIDKQRLFKIIENRLRTLNIGHADALMYLLNNLIFHDCVKNHTFKGNPQLIDAIPDHKTLFKAMPNKGLPIGNLTSQFFANVYLDRLDQFVKHILKCKYYIRYVDDTILLSHDLQELIAWRDQIKAFLKEDLDLQLKNEGIIQRVTHGANFLGYIVRPTYVLVRRRVVNNLKYRLKTYKELILKTFTLNGKSFTRIDIEPEKVNNVRQTLASYLGHFKHANAYQLVLSIFEHNPWLLELFELKNGKLIERYKCRRNFNSLRIQVNYFRIRLKSIFTMYQVGKYFEVYDDDAWTAHYFLGIKVNKGKRAMRYSAGIPFRFGAACVKKMLLSGNDVAVLMEDEIKLAKIKDRHVRYIYRVV